MFKKILRIIFRQLCRVLYRVELTGDLSNFQNEKTLIIANHQSLLDGMLFSLFLPVEATYVVNTAIAKKPFFKLMLGMVRYIPVDPTNPLALKQIIQRLNDGETIVIFPEGRISVSGSLMKTYPGTGLIAARTGATIVPVSIDGALYSPFSYVTRLFPVKWFPKIKLMVHPRQKLTQHEGPAREARSKSGADLHRILQSMTVDARDNHTLFEAMLHARSRYGGNYALIEDVRMQEETYNQILKMAFGAARLLMPKTSEGEAVGILLPNTTGTVAAVFGLSAFKRVPAMLNYSAGIAGVQAACHSAKVKTIVTSRLFIEKGNLQALAADLEKNHTVLYFEDLKASLTTKDKLWVIANYLRPTAFLPKANPNDAALILFTSGSEGKPKGVVHSHSSLLANTAQVRACADFTPADKFFVALPLFHSFGFTCGALLPLVAGIKLFLYPTPLHYRIIPELVYDKNATVMFGTSTFLGSYAKFAHAYDFARLRYVVAGAEKLSDAVRNVWFEKFGIRILVGYGVTECAPVVAVNTPMAAKTGSVGKLMPSMESRLIPVPGIDNAGALFVRGPNVMLGYFRYENPGVLEAPAAFGQSGWYETGDIVSIDEHGFITIEGRIKRFAKVAGEMVSLDLAEQIATRASPQAYHAVLAQEDAAKGESLTLLTTDPALTRRMLSEAAKLLGATELAVPRIIRNIPMIPVLGSGKTDYVSLKLTLADFA